MKLNQPKFHFCFQTPDDDSCEKEIKVIYKLNFKTIEFDRSPRVIISHLPVVQKNKKPTELSHAEFIPRGVLNINVINPRTEY